MTEETIFQSYSPRGQHRDILLGPTGEIIWERPWQSNLIVDGLRNLLARLLKGDSIEEAPLKAWAVGTGSEDWDNGNLPSEAERRGRTGLYNEVMRKPLEANNITFVGENLTNQLEINIDFKFSDFSAINSAEDNISLREFGLFANGDTSDILINHRIHPRIDVQKTRINMQETFTLKRTLRLTF